MTIFARNARTREALGIESIEFQFYRAGNSHWRVVMKDGESFTLAAHNLATESTVLRLAAEKLAKAGKAVKYPEGA